MKTNSPLYRSGTRSWRHWYFLDFASLVLLFAISRAAHAETFGSFDPSFKHILDGGTIIPAIAVQPDGRILIGGGNFLSDQHHEIARLESDGTMENVATFHPGDGDVQATRVRVNSITLQSNGKILYVDNVIARLFADGTPESTATFNPQFADVVAIAVQPDGKIMLVGDFTIARGETRNRIARINANGSLDTTFNPGDGPNDRVFAVALQADGKILVGGNFSQFNGQTRRGIARLYPDGTLDPDFSHNVETYSSAECIAVQPDENILLGGEFHFDAIPTPDNYGIVRLTPNGTLVGRYLYPTLELPAWRSKRTEKF